MFYYNLIINGSIDIFEKFLKQKTSSQLSAGDISIDEYKELIDYILKVQRIY